jgi:hypothetical protein
MDIHYSKNLKLTNALMAIISEENSSDQCDSFQLLVERMDLHIRQKGSQPIGPLIQKTDIQIDTTGKTQMVVTFIRQSDTFIHRVDSQYKMESVIKISNCLYTRFIGDEDNIQFAYNKLHLVGYEEEIPLSTETYTVFVDADEEEGTITADIFVPKAQ